MLRPSLLSLALASAVLGCGPQPMRIAPGSNHLRHVTPDGQVIFEANDRSVLEAVPFGGGTPTVIQEGTASRRLSYGRRTVFAWDSSTIEEVLTVWSAATGPHVAGPSSSADGAAAADDSGTWVLYALRPDDTGYQLVESDTALQGPRVLATGSCIPHVELNAGRALARYCDGATTVVASWTPGAWDQRVAIGVDGGKWIHDGKGLRSLFLQSSGTSMVVTLADGTAVPLDSDDPNAVISPDGEAVIYVSQADHVLKRSSMSAPAPIALASGATTPVSPSPDFSQVAFAQYAPPLPQPAFLLASTSEPGTPSGLVASADLILASPSPFTEDGAFFVSSSEIDPPASPEELWAQPLAGGAPIHLTTGVVPTRVFTAQRGRVAWLDSLGSDPTLGPIADLRSMDLHGSAGPRLLASGVPLFGIALAPRRDAFAYEQLGDQPGIYTPGVP